MFFIFITFSRYYSCTLNFRRYQRKWYECANQTGKLFMRLYAKLALQNLSLSLLLPLLRVPTDFTPPRLPTMDFVLLNSQVFFSLKNSIVLVFYFQLWKYQMMDARFR
jgi:hypothetical protein